MTTALRHRIGNPEIAHKVSSPEEYVQTALRVIVGNGGTPRMLREYPDPVPAYVSDGRWVVRCPGCPNGPSAHPEWKMAVCFECGAILTVTFPANWKTGEEILLARQSPHERHWFPDRASARAHGLPKAETVDALERENVAKKRPVRVRPEDVEPATTAGDQDAELKAALARLGWGPVGVEDVEARMRALGLVSARDR